MREVSSGHGSWHGGLCSKKPHSVTGAAALATGVKDRDLFFTICSAELMDLAQLVRLLKVQQAKERVG